VVAPDMLERYPINPMQFASGKIISETNSMCIGTMKHNYDEPIGLVNCSRSHGTDFILTMERSIKVNDTNDQCLDSHRLTFNNCHHMGGNQGWKFDIVTRQIIQSGECLSADFETAKISLVECKLESQQQKWKWTFENQTALTNWDKSGVQVG
jgi:hypothetical protein